MCVFVSCWNFYTKYTPCYVNRNERKHSADGKTRQDIKLQIIWWLGEMKINLRCSVLIFEKLWYPATLWSQWCWRVLYNINQQNKHLLNKYFHLKILVEQWCILLVYIIWLYYNSWCKKHKICCWRRSTYIVSSQVLKKCSTFIFMVKQPKDWRWRHYDTQKHRTYWPSDTALTSPKTWMFSSTTVKIWNFTNCSDTITKQKLQYEYIWQ